LLPAFRATTKAGNVIITALTPDSVEEIKVPPLELFVTQKAIMGAVYGFASPRLQIPELLALYRNGSLKLRELVTRRYRLDEVNQGYLDLAEGKNLRGVVVFAA
jgi:alcohol dehydrogenase/S-(hydroxymethyl)glutathione dehydrogenase/alcohol dehydrogenase